MAANDLQNINKLYGIPGSGVPSYGTPALGGSGSKDQAYINQMYDAALSGQKTQLEQNYTQNQADLDRSQEQAQKKADTDLTRTYVEAAKDARNYTELQNAYGLSSGAMAQARLAQDNQLEGDLTAIRTAQQTIDADIEHQRVLLGEQYRAAIAQAQAENDLERAQALYEAAKAEEERMLQMQLQAGELMASAGDYSILARLYGLTPQQLALLQEKYGGGSGGGGSTYYKQPGKEQEELTAEEAATMKTADTALLGGLSGLISAPPAKTTVNPNPAPMIGPMIPNAPIQPSRYNDSKSGLK